MLTPDQLLKTQLAMLPSGEVIGSQDNFVTWQIVFTPNTVKAEYANLLGASAMMYGVLNDITGGMEGLVELLEQAGADKLGGAVYNLVASAKVTMEAAQVGTAALAARKTQPPQK